MPFHSAAALTLLAAAAFAVAAPPAAVESRSQSPDPVGRAVERFNLGLRGVYFVENRGQWSDGSVCFGLKSRGLDVAFRESSFTMHLSRECSEPGCATPTSRAREDAGLGEEGEHPSIDLRVPYGLVSDYGGHFADHRVPLSRGRRAPLPHGRGSSGDLLHHEIRGVEDSAPAYEHLTLTVSFPGSNPVTPRGAREQTAKFNYFVGGEGRGTASNVPSFGAVVYENLYNGIDLLVTGNDDGVMKYEFHCAPGADYPQIRIHYEGIDSLCVNDDGDLEIATSFGTLLDGAPIVWQEEDGSTSRAREEAGFCQSPGSARGEHGRTAGEGRGGGDSATRALEQAGCSATSSVHQNPLLYSRGSSDSTIPARFELIDATTYRIALASDIDPTRMLIIDPEVEWMRYLGGTGLDSANQVATDHEEHAYVTGETTSFDFEGRNNNRFGGNDDTFIVKVAPSGEVFWMTYIGGTGGEVGFGLSVAQGGTVYVAGTTTSSDFEGALNSYHGGESDGYIAAIDVNGHIAWMNYIGGTNEDRARAIAIDSVGHLFVAGTTASADFAGRTNTHHGGVNDAFALRIHPSGNTEWMIFTGGELEDDCWAVAADESGRALLVGQTNSHQFFSRTNQYHGGPTDAFLTTITSSGIPAATQYIGGTGEDVAQSVASAMDGVVLVSGRTNSLDIIRHTNSYHGGRADAFVMATRNPGTILWATYLGGSDYEYGRSLDIDEEQNVLVSGWTESPDFEWRNNSLRGIIDGFVARLNVTGDTLWMTYLGGGGFDWSQSITVLDSGTAMISGYTHSYDFEGRQNVFHGGGDAYLLRMSITDSPRLLVNSSCPQGGPIQIEWSGASPDGRVALIYARNSGRFLIPARQPCSGRRLGLGVDSIRVVYDGNAGTNGSRILRTIADPSACGGYLQLLDLTTCATSNVARIE